MTNLNNVSFGNAAVAVQPTTVKPATSEKKPMTDEQKQEIKENSIKAVSIISLIGIAGLLLARGIKGKGVQVDPKTTQALLPAPKPVLALPAPKAAGAISEAPVPPIFDNSVNGIMDRFNKYPKTHSYDPKATERAKEAAKSLANAATKREAAVANATVADAMKPGADSGIINGAIKNLAAKRDAALANATMADAMKPGADSGIINAAIQNAQKNATPVLDPLQKAAAARDAALAKPVTLQEAVNGDNQTAQRFLDQVIDGVKKNGVKENVTASGIILPDPKPVRKAATPVVAMPAKKSTPKPTISAEAVQARLDAAKAKAPMSAADRLASLAAQGQKQQAQQGKILLSA